MTFGRSPEGFKILADFSDAARFNGRVCLRGLDKIRQHVGRAQHDLEHGLVGLQRARTHLVQRRLERVGEPHKRFQPERASAALNGVNRAEHGVHRLVVAFPRLQSQQPSFKFAEQLFAFLEESYLDRLERIHRMCPIIPWSRGARRATACRS